VWKLNMRERKREKEKEMDAKVILKL